jgi:tol-pal system protein YbgF
LISPRFSANPRAFHRVLGDTDLVTSLSLSRGWALRIAVVLVTLGFALPAHAQNNQQAAQLQVRIQQLEEQIRILTGQVEGLQFQLTQMQVLLEKMQQDNEFRFQELEGGEPGNPQAATETVGEMPAAELPQDQTAAAVPADPALTPVPGLNAPEAGDPLGTPMDALPGDVGESQDPLVGTSETGPGTLGPLTLDSATPSSNPDAQAQYNAGYDAVVRGDYAFAEEQFRQFVALYPDDPQAADATNWLGEALLQRGAYDEAADVALTGFQNYPNSPRAPDLLLKVAIALAAVGEREAACRTFVEITSRYQGLSQAFVDRLRQEEAKAECPPAG